MLVKACASLILVALLFGVTAQLCHAQKTAGVQQLAEKLIEAQTEDQRQALLAAEKELATAELVKELMDRADGLRLRGNYDQVMALGRFTQALAERLGDQVGVVRVLQQIGNVHQNRGEYDLALEYYRKSLPLAEASKYQRGIIVFYINVGLTYRLQGEAERAVEYYEQALKISEAAKDKNGIASVLNLIGAVHRVRGNHRLALEYYQRSLSLFEELEFHSGVAGLLNNIGTIYVQQAQLELAEASYRKSLALAQKFKNRPQVAQALNNLGRVYRERLDNPRALEVLEQSLAIREEIGDKLGMARTLHNIGEMNTSSTVREYERALDYYQKALAIFESLKNTLGQTVATASIARVHLLRGDYKFSLEWSARALALARDSDRTYLDQLLANAGRAHQGLKQFDRARHYYAESIAAIEDLRTQVAGGELGQQSYFEAYISPYQDMIGLLVDQNQWNEAFGFAEQAKARVLLDVLQSGRINVSKAMTAAEREQESKLRRALVTLNNQITREGQNSKPDEAQLVNLQAKLRTMRVAYEDFQTKLYAAHPELRIQRAEVRPIKLEEAGELLPDARTALVEYVVTKDKTFLFVITRSGAPSLPVELKVYTVDVKASDLAEQTERFRNQLAKRDLTYADAAHRLYDLLLKPAEAQLRGRETLVIVPDAKLWELPFQALKDGHNRHLIESRAISYAPSLTVLREVKKGHGKNPPGSASRTTLLAVGNPTLGKETIRKAQSVLMGEKFDPLPEAEKQVMALGKLYGPAGSRVYVRDAAREGLVKAQARDYRILHLATHGVLNDVSPMYSHVLLAQEDGNLTEDGLLEAWELMNLNLNADLVVLSACETARGHVGAGEGVIGLTWALFVAGSPTTVVSQWKVEAASTTQLMVDFHRNLRQPTNGAPQRMSTSKGLQRAAIKMLGNKESKHPFYWAGFVVVGDGR